MARLNKTTRKKLIAWVLVRLGAALRKGVPAIDFAAAVGEAMADGKLTQEERGDLAQRFAHALGIEVVIKEAK